MNRIPEIPDNCQWGIFLRNHDELTLEMVTEEERNYMWQEYAYVKRMKCNLGIRRRLSPLLNKDEKKIKLLFAILFTMPGCPIVYYGDEIGMGDNIYLYDRNGVRTPMQWNDNRNTGFSKCNPSMLYNPIIIDPEYHYMSLNVEVQQSNNESLLNWMKNIIRMRKKYKVIGSSNITFLNIENKSILAYLRKEKDEMLLCIFNLSKDIQMIEFDMKQYADYYLCDVFTDRKMKKIETNPLLLTFNSYGYYILNLKK